MFDLRRSRSTAPNEVPFSSSLAARRAPREREWPAPSASGARGDAPLVAISGLGSVTVTTGDRADVDQTLRELELIRKVKHCRSQAG